MPDKEQRRWSRYALQRKVKGVQPVTAATKLPFSRAPRVALLKTAAPGTERIELRSMRGVGKMVAEYAEAGWSVMNQSSCKPVTASFLNTDPHVTVWFRKD